MADLFFEDVRSNEELIAIALQLLQRANEGDDNALIAAGSVNFLRIDGQPSRITASQLWSMYDTDEYGCYNPEHSWNCECVWEAAQTDPRQGRIFEAAPEPLQYIACPQRGTHAMLAECWMCWCDVERGSILAAEALAPEEVAA